MKKILGVTTLLAAAAIAGGAVLIHSNSREPIVPASETTRTTYRLTGDEMEVDSSGPVTITVVTGSAGEVVVDRRLRWTGPKRHAESWSEHRMAIDYECGGGDCGADYRLSVPGGTRVRFGGVKANCPPEIACEEA
ncbi:hypothetical protein ABT340_36200 [Streptosporangium sp. NPDC000239]|uniref:hypothetical protein n=1 Tax=Streptosporangium sp. NPDC000239 TaxID=3154248 RepID=UPI00332EF603